MKEDANGGRDVTVKLAGQSMHGETGSVSWMKMRALWEKRPVLLVAVVVLTIGSPFFGLFLAGLDGVVVGLVSSIAAFAGGIFAITRVRTITVPNGSNPVVPRQEIEMLHRLNGWQRLWFVISILGLLYAVWFALAEAQEVYGSKGAVLLEFARPQCKAVIDMQAGHKLEPSPGLDSPCWNFVFISF